MADPKRVALALGAGGARGYAHIGVIEVLEERGYEIVSIAGSSMGALVGGLHAAGKLDGYTEWVRTLTRRDLRRLIDPSLKAPGAIRAEKIMSRVTDLLDGAVIENLPIAFTAVATDLLARKEVWFQHGPVDVAIRASIAIPSFITPVMLNGRLLADGGLMNPVPTAPTASSRADFTVAVSLDGESHPVPAPAPAPSRESSESRPVEDWVDRFRRTAAQVLERDMVRQVASRVGARRVSAAAAAEQTVEEIFGELPPGLRMLDVMEFALDSMQSVVTNYRLAGYPADVYISVPKSAARSLEFDKAQELIGIGRLMAEQALDLQPRPRSAQR